LADGVLFRESIWLAFDAAILASFNLFYCKVQNLQHSILMVKDCKPVFLEGFLQPIFFQWILDLVVSNKVDFAVFNAMFGEGVYRWPFSSLSLQAPAGGGCPK
jgi:hypothetical protein